MNGKGPHTRWIHMLATIGLLTAALACSTMAPTPTPTPRRAPTRTAIPTWTPTPAPTFTPTPSTGTISGQVINASDGSPVPQANVQTDPPTVSVTTDSSGRYTIAEVAPGPYTVTGAKPGYGSASVAIAVTAGRTTTADVHLGPASVVTPSPTVESSLSDGLVLYYPFNGSADDQSGNRNHGTVYGAALAADRFGRQDSAYAFDGVDDYIEVADDDTLDLDTHLTISLWVLRPEGDTSRRARLVDKTTAGINNGYNFDWARTMRLTGGIDNTVSNTEVPLGVWHHMVVVFENGVSTFYLDGTEDGGGKHGSALQTNSLTLRIGAGHGGDSTPFLGVLDDVRIYNRALSETEVQALYSGDDGLVAYYPFNGNADDESGNGYHGIVHGATPTADRFGRENSAYRFDGTDYIITSLDMTRVWSVGDPIHLSLWIKTTAAPGIALAGKPGGGPDFAAVLEDGSGRMRVRLYGGVNATSDIPVNDDRWHHICWGTDGTASYFHIDGTPQSSAPSVGTHNREVAVIFGAREKSPVTFFDGAIDDVRIYNRALSGAEVQALYMENDSLVAYYPFNGNADDESGNGNHGIVHGAILTDDRFGKPRSAYSFDGIDDYIASSSNISLDTTFSVVLWFKYAETTKGGTIFHRGYGGWCWYEPNIVINESSMLIAKVSGCDNEGAAGTFGITSSEWYQVAIVARDRSQEFYVNGKEIGSTRHTNRYTFSYKAFIGVLANQNTPTVSHFHGTIDDVRIYNRALDESEIQALYREGEWASESGLPWPGHSSNRATLNTDYFDPSLSLILLPAKRPAGHTKDDKPR